jgi:hypothetical protein
VLLRPAKDSAGRRTAENVGATVWCDVTGSTDDADFEPIKICHAQDRTMPVYCQEEIGAIVGYVGKAAGSRFVKVRDLRVHDRDWLWAIDRDRYEGCRFFADRNKAIIDFSLGNPPRLRSISLGAYDGTYYDARDLYDDINSLRQDRWISGHLVSY